MGRIYVVYTRLWSFKLKDSSLLGTLNHTKANQPNSIRKLGCVPSEQHLLILTLRDSDWYGTDGVRQPEIHWVLHLIKLSGFVVLIYGLGFHQDGQKDVH